MRHPPTHAKPDTGCKDFIEKLNANGIPLPDLMLQFERHGYFVADRVDHVQGSKPMFNLAVGLRDIWEK